MLTRFFVDNYKTHINSTFEAAPLNLLLGANNSGKTNLCQAIRLVGGSSRTSLAAAAAEAAGEVWSLGNAHLSKDTIDFRVEAGLAYQEEDISFVYELTVRLLDPRAAKEAEGRLIVKKEQLRATGRDFDNTVLISNDEGSVRLLHETRKVSSRSDMYVETTAPGDASMLSRLYDLKDNPRANLFKRYLSSWLYYDLDTQQLRRPEARILETVLSVDGGNLASVLFNLKNGNERLYRRLLDVTRRAIDPSIELLSFFSPAENQVFMFAEDPEGHRYGPWSMSNGTLRFLALGYILASSQSFAEIGGPRLVIIEEPETGLYAGHLRNLFDLVDPTGRNGQYIFTSHAPYFIDFFDKCLEGITIAKRGPKHSQLVKPDVAKIRSKLESMSLGELHFREMIG